MDAIDLFQTIRIPVTVLHVISVVFGMGAALVSDLLFSFFGHNKQLTRFELSVLSLLARIVSISLVVISLSGVMIFFSNPDKYIHSMKFLAKMTILAVLLVNGYVLNHYIWPHLLRKSFFFAQRERRARITAFLCGAISVISWLAVCTLGVLDSLPYSYAMIMQLYAGVLMFGIVVAILVERHELH